MSTFVTVIAIVLLITPLIVAGYMLHQIDKAAKRHEAPVKIWLVDLFSLIFLIQLPLTFVARNANKIDIQLAAIVAVIFCAIMSTVWWSTIKTVSRAGITNTFWRSVISLFVIPMAYLGSFAIMGISGGMLNPAVTKNRLINLMISNGILFAFLVAALVLVQKAIASANQSQSTNESEVASLPYVDEQGVD